MLARVRDQVTSGVLITCTIVCGVRQAAHTDYLAVSFAFCFWVMPGGALRRRPVQSSDIAPGDVTGRM